MSHSLTMDGEPNGPAQVGDQILEEGGLSRAIGLMDGLNASQAVSNLLGYRHVNIPNIPYNRPEGAPSVAISFAVDQVLQEDPDQVGQQVEPEHDREHAYDNPEYERTYGSPDSEIWREEEEMYLEMTSNGQTDGQSVWEIVDLDTSIEPEPKLSQDQDSYVDQAVDNFPRCEYHLA